MSGAGRQVLFNPTSLPGLRLQRAPVQYARTTARCIGRGLNRSTGLRRVSTLTGEDESGHIAAHTNEGILFFDSKFPISYLQEVIYNNVADVL
jgi:hypothetical protein